MKKSIFKFPYYLLIIPLILAYFAKSGYGFVFKASVPGSCILILVFLHRKVLSTISDVWYVFAAFFFSIIGDWFLSNKGDSFIMFSLGISFFFIAHVGYLGFALANGKLHKFFTVVLLSGYIVFFFLCMFPAINDTVLLIATFLYLLISCFSFGAAFGIKLKPVVKWSYFLGITFVLFSDTIIALSEFTKYRELNFLILPTYYAAHIIITFAIMKKIYYKANIAIYKK